MIFSSEKFDLASGERIAELEIVYECYGELNDQKNNAIMVAHGITSSHFAAGPPTADRRRGWYDELIGPGKLLDTDLYCVISSNCLGSCYGSTGPGSINPATGMPYGRDFPDISYEDIVRAQHLLLRSLGVRSLKAFVASSIGGFQAFQWAVTFPGFAEVTIALDTATRDTFDVGSTLPGLLDRLAADPNWNDGDFYSVGSMAGTLTQIRIETLKSYGFEEKLDAGLSASERETILWETAQEWAKEFDPNSLLLLMRAWATFDVEDKLGRISAPILYVLCNTDEWFPASIGEEVLEKLKKAKVDATFLQIDSRLGHFATTEESEKWVPTAREFIRPLG